MIRTSNLCIGLTFALLGAPAFARTGAPSKDHLSTEMLSLERQARDAEASGNPALAAQLMRRFETIRASLGGDDPRASRRSASTTALGPVAQSGPAQLVSLLCGGGTTSTVSVSNAPGLPVLDNQTVLDTITVSGAPTILWDLDVQLNITHTYPADLDIFLTSPAGTVITISTDNGGTNDNAFAGTVFDDSSPNSSSDYAYTLGFPAPSLASEEPLSHLRGEDPNGTWTISVFDDANLDQGAFVSWGLDITTITSLPPTPAAPTNFANTTPSPIPDLGFTSSTITVSGLDVSISDLNLTLNVTHTYSSDLAITLMSPLGTTFVVCSGNGGGLDDVFAGTLFDDSAANTANDAPFINGVAMTAVAPETPFDRANGEDPNGVWTLTIADEAGADTGTLNSWSLDISTCATAGTPFCFGDGSLMDHTTGCPCGNNGAPGNGCAHSFNTGGANITATGTTSADDIVLHSSGEPATSFTLMMQHGNAGDSVFHDGVLCAGNPLIRLRGRAAVAGEAFFPNSNFAQDSTTTLSARGGVVPGSGAVRYYAGWFRNASTTFCPPATANVTNGWVITW